MKIDPPLDATLERFPTGAMLVRVMYGVRSRSNGSSMSFRARSRRGFSRTYRSHSPRGTSPRDRFGSDGWSSRESNSSVISDGSSRS